MSYDHRQPPFSNERFEPIAFVARGGWGFVWRYRQRGAGQFISDVAIKFVPTAGADQIALRAWEEEVSHLRRGRANINVVTLYDVLQPADDLIALVMEYVDGQRLDQRIMEGPIDPDEALSLALAMSDGLRAFHSPPPGETPSIHLDLKPANVILANDGSRRVLKLLDTGVSAYLHRTDMVVGTREYRAPEQYYQATCESDYWPIGLMLFEMVTGLPLHHFLAERMDGGFKESPELSRAIGRTVLGELRRNAGVEERIRNVIAGLLAEDPAERGGRRLLLEAIRTARGGGAPVAPPAVSPMRRLLPPPSPSTAPAGPVLDPLVELSADGSLTPASAERIMRYLEEIE